MKDKRCGNAIFYARPVNGLKALAKIVQGGQHHVLVLVGDADVGDDRGILDHLARNLAFFVSHGPENTGQERGGQSEAGANAKKSPAVQHEVSLRVGWNAIIVQAIIRPADGLAPGELRSGLYYRPGGLNVTA